MKKSEKIMIGILVLILLVMTAILILTKIKVRKQDICIERDNPASSNETNNLENSPKEIGRIVKVNGKLYYDTGRISEGLRCGMLDGNITKVVEGKEIPTNDGEANFEGANGYQYGRESNTIEVPIDNKWVIFEAKEYSFCGTITQVEQNLFFVEPDEGEEIRKTANLIKVGIIRLDTNVKFEVGEKIRVTYTGEVLDKYTAEVYAISYESLDNYKETITLNSKTASNEILIKFNGILYGKSFSLIDYAGGGEKIGTIDKLIDSKYIPKFDGETNNKEILGASVFEASEKTIVLNYNNTYVLFEKI